MKQIIASLAAGAMLMAAPHGAPPKGPLAGQVIVVDPGHGGRDSGARAGNLFESDVVLAIGKEVGSALRAQGAKVVMSRSDQNNLEATAHGGNLQRKNLAARVALAERVKADLFLSLHANKYPAYPSAHGAQLFLGEHPTPEQERLAASLMAELGPLTDSKRTIDAKRSLYLMDHLKTTAVLIEFGFLSNAREKSLMTQPEYQKKLAAAVARGVVNYCASSPPPAKSPAEKDSGKGHKGKRTIHRRTVIPRRRRIAAPPARGHRVYPSVRA